MINKNIKGITLIEILIGVVISSIMMGAMLTSYNVVNGSYRQVIDKASIGNSSRTFSDMLLRDIRMAGYKHFDDPLITFEDNSNPNIPIEIVKNANNTCCDRITIVYGDFDRNLADERRFKRFKATYSSRASTTDDGVFQILKTNQQWNNTAEQWEDNVDNFETYTDEVVADFVADIEFIAKDELGNSIIPPPTWNNQNNDQIYSIHTVEVFLTFRSKNEFYNNSRARTITSLFSTQRDQENSDRFLREPIVLNAYTRNLESFR